MKMLLKYTVLLITVLAVNVWCQRLYIYEESAKTLDEDVFAHVKDKSMIQFLDIRANRFVRVLDTTFQGFDNLNTLDISKNYIECLPEDVFQGVQGVESLGLGSNKLKYLHKNTFSVLRKLKGLGINDNLLKKLEIGLFDNTISLENLNLQDNLLSYIPEGTFSKLNNLKLLDLSSNYIHYIERNAMPSAVPTNMRFLWIWGNRLQNLDLYDSTLNSLEGSNFDKNPMYCDCKTKRVFKKWAAKFRGNGWEPSCDGPEHLRNRGWTTLVESDFTCERNVVRFSLESNKFPQIGENLVLACHINLPVGDISITYKNGTNVVEHLRRRRRFPSLQSDATEEHSWYKLTIKDVQTYDAGSYICVVNGKAEREILLSVDDPSYYEKCVANTYFSGK